MNKKLGIKIVGKIELPKERKKSSYLREAMISKIRKASPNFGAFKFVCL